MIIAGGCIRDFRLGLEPKDLDVFIDCRTRSELKALGDRLNDLTGNGWVLDFIQPGQKIDGHAPSDGDGVPDLIGVLDGTWRRTAINIIARTDHADGVDALMHGFDFAILRTYFDGAVHETADAIKDYRDFTATLTGTRGRMDLSVARFEKFDARNPGVLTLVNPFEDHDDASFGNL